MGRKTKGAGAGRSVVAECGTEESGYKQHDWRVWDAHFRRCNHCGRIEAVGISAQAMTPVTRTSGRGRHQRGQHEWVSHPWWSNAQVDVQVCSCGQSRAVKRKPVETAAEKAGAA